ncbi:MAG: DNA recombination protein RmuC [Pseudomonadota bacterium]
MRPVLLIGDTAFDAVHTASFALCLVLIAALIWLRARSRERLAEQSAEAERRIAGLETELSHAAARRDEAREMVAGLEQRLRTQSEVARAAELKLAAAEARSAEDRKEFADLAQGALRQANAQFLELANETFAKHKEGARGDLETLMKPIGESFTEFKTRIDSLEKVRVGDKTALQEQVRAIQDSLHQNTRETGKLVNALTAPKGGGRWGEMTLRNVMEQAGLSAYCDFNEQVHDATESGAQRPDAVIHLPGDRQIVVDSKVSLEAYLKASSSEDPAERAACLKAHAGNVQRHIKQLASKGYQDNLDERVDFVAMFIPGENFFAAALEHSPSMLEEAYQKGVIVTTPSTLIGLAKTVSYVWRQEKMAENAREAATLGAQLFERLSVMANHIEKLGRSLNQSVDNYNKMSRSLETRVLPGARKFQELSIAPPNKALPEIKAIETRADAQRDQGALQLTSDDEEAA